MKRLTVLLLCLLVALLPVAAAETDAPKPHKIGVLVYSATDEEVLSFRQYLEEYVQGCFEGVSFVYSDGVTSQEAALAFIDACAENGVEGILSFNSYDLRMEVARCTEYGIYYELASGTVTDEQFEAVADEPCFLGVIGPGTELEYEAGAQMAQWAYESAAGDEYFILSGGAGMGNEMHRRRTVGILDRLQACYGVDLEGGSEALALSMEPTRVSAGALSLCVCPGYPDFDVFLEPAKQAYEALRYGKVLSVLPISAMAETVSGARLGVVDCYSEGNMRLTADGQLCYVVGKYPAMIGPSFALMYNALCGYADAFREGGRAVRLTQGFWSSDSSEAFLSRYTLATSLEVNAYNYEDLYSVCRLYDPEATMERLAALTEAYSYEDVLARRGLAD